MELVTRMRTVKKMMMKKRKQSRCQVEVANRLAEVKARARRRLQNNNADDPTARRLRPGLRECQMVVPDSPSLKHPVAVILMERALAKVNL
jgi:hypothetical protein